MWHLGLIYKLVCLKVPYYIIMIVWAFLKDRTFVVKIDGEVSSIKLIICGVVFDKRIKFSAHVDKLDEKIRDRINILKILSYDKNFGLDKSTLVNMDLRNDFEIIQNNAIRIIFNLKLSDIILFLITKYR